MYHPIILYSNIGWFVSHLQLLAQKMYWIPLTIIITPTVIIININIIIDNNQIHIVDFFDVELFSGFSSVLHVLHILV